MSSKFAGTGLNTVGNNDQLALKGVLEWKSYIPVGLKTILEVPFCDGLHCYRHIQSTMYYRY